MMVSVSRPMLAAICPSFAAGSAFMEAEINADVLGIDWAWLGDGS